MNPTNILVNQAAVAGIVVHVIDVLHLPKATARVISIVIAFLASAGFVLHYSGSLFAGGEILLQWPSFPTLMQALCSAVVQFMMQEGYYQGIIKTPKVVTEESPSGLPEHNLADDAATRAKKQQDAIDAATKAFNEQLAKIKAGQ